MVKKSVGNVETKTFDVLGDLKLTSGKVLSNVSIA